MNTCDVRRIFISSFRLYFAPLFGAMNGAYRQTRIELEKIESDRKENYRNH